MRKCRTHKNCINNAVREAELICQSRGLRFTDLRRTVLKIIWTSHRSIKAYDILDKLKDSRYSAEPPTVYRALDFLLENGLIHKLDSLNAYVGCAHPHKHDQCYFLICSECHEIKECCDQRISDAIAETTTKNKFSSKHATLEISGKCSECAARK